jgi:hypothetical protein
MPSAQRQRVDTKTAVIQTAMSYQFARRPGMMNCGEPEGCGLVPEGHFAQNKLTTARNSNREQTEDLDREEWIHVTLTATGFWPILIVVGAP